MQQHQHQLLVFLYLTPWANNHFSSSSPPEFSSLETSLRHVNLSPASLSRSLCVSSGNMSILAVYRSIRANFSAKKSGSTSQSAANLFRLIFTLGPQFPLFSEKIFVSRLSISLTDRHIVIHGGSFPLWSTRKKTKKRLERLNKLLFHWLLQNCLVRLKTYR